MTLNKLFVLILLLCGLSSCSSDGGGGTTAKTPEELLAAGWTSYAGHNYAGALSYFTQAYQAKGSLTDAYNGAGWANARLGSMTAAKDRFVTGFSADSTNLQIVAGLALVYNALKDYPSSVMKANTVLQTNSTWFFTRDVSISATDLHLLLAEDYFAEGDFINSIAQIKLLNASFTADVTTDAGKIALASEIERLRPLV
jgi:tetratricopeptide (TPR) repeat protein